MKADAKERLVPVVSAHLRIQVVIDNRLQERRSLHEKLLAIDAEIVGLREAQDQIDKLAQ